MPSLNPPSGPEPVNPAMFAAVEGGVEDANNAAANEADEEARKREENEVSELWEEFEQAREFDKEARAQYALDRRYAAGTAHLDWAVDANLIGSFIDILVSFLFARNPDVSVKKAERVDNIGTVDEDDFAKTTQIIVSKLWRSPHTRFKQQCRAQVRAALTTGIGWFKATLQCKGTNIPQMQNELNDSRKNIAQLEALKAKYAPQPVMDEAGVPTVDEMGQPVMQPSTYQPTDDDQCKTEEEVDAELGKMRDLEASLAQRLEVAVRKGLVVDFCSSENVQVSLDVPNLDDYTSASWMANIIHVRTKELKTKFPRLTGEDRKSAKQYYLKKRRDLEPLSDRQRLTGIAGAEYKADEADQYVTDDGKSSAEGNKDVPFARIVELWNRDTGHVYTMVEGVKRWAKEPFQPDYPTSRFFPYFGLMFYNVDGTRHPQSLPWRLMKLQDEYAGTRSGQRLTRQRAKPGTVFNKAGMSPEDAKALAGSTEQELIGITPTNQEQRIGDLFAPKPVEIPDMRLYDTEPVLRDMERISGVQEALAQTSQAEKTATQAEIEQTGFASRTTSDRDTLETMLGEFATYTAELALSGIDAKEATRMAGAKAFWPHGMAIDDLLTLVEIEIEAGTTGKPKNAGDKEAWGIVLPLLKEMLVQIIEAQAVGQTPIADALKGLLQETMNRMGDSTDISKWIPDVQPIAPAPGAPGAPGMPPPGAPPGAPVGDVPPVQGEMPDAGGAPPADGWQTPPEIVPPVL